MRVGLRRSNETPAESAPQDSREAGDLRRRLDQATRQIANLREQLFELQEQNQQLRRDLTAGVCPRLCANPFRSAS